MIGETFVVGVCGQARSGKDTSVQILLDYEASYPEIKGKRYAFADALKDIYANVKAVANSTDQITIAMANRRLQIYANILGSEELVQKAIEYFAWLGTHEEQMRLPMNEETKELHRPLLIDLGLRMRALMSDYWVHPVGALIGQSELPFAFVSDARFPNELGIVDAVIRIVRPGCEVIYDPISTKISASEIFSLTGEFDFLVPNNYGLRELRNEIHKAAHSLVALRDLTLEELKNA